MKQKFKYRKKLIELANKIGLIDATVLTGQKKPVADEGYFELVNNQRRFVKGILKLPLHRQELRIKALEKAIENADKEYQAKLEQQEKEAKNDSNGTGNS